MQRLLALDLDGTLLRSDGTLGGRTRVALQEATQLGWVVFPVTARPSRNAVALALEEDWPEIACSNGAVTHRSDGEVLQIVPFHVPEVRAFVETARAALPGITFGAEWGEYMTAEQAYDELRGGGNPIEVGRHRPVNDVLLDLKEAKPPLKLMARHPHFNGPNLVTLLQQGTTELSITASTMSFAEITAAGVNKVAAVKAACQRHQISQAQVVAFGDMPIDAPLLAWVGHGVAVANSRPDVLVVADEVTASNDQEGVALVLERLLSFCLP
ncbi:HAD family hydrolase [Deinococcus hopiensis]|uniref:Cof subfamily of IIB subfamily of haloacid dehalogenase superfamily/HAD-superfamily hydrolase, subfamily IIB n=1 Tax=Deinococcus hopiensis KR-140 TaxID=695939 RepID=A0A1W1UYP4_9DEIO|nr:HAD-IIB family hydrolase [Deinococcus hopiensis]SMB86218.1 hypothetical protein SAMN00790413_03733 [Deinococcus hopiensis KR-140]